VETGTTSLVTKLTESSNFEAPIYHFIAIIHIGWVERQSHKCNDGASVASRYDDAKDPVPP
jgi:hypothetical protein